MKKLTKYSAAPIVENATFLRDNKMSDKDKSNNNSGNNKPFTNSDDKTWQEQRKIHEGTTVTDRITPPPVKDKK